MPKFSIIMQCFLGEYKGAASNREEKLIRAIDSVIGQSMKDWEMIVVADGCEKTFDIIEGKYAKEKRIDCFLIKKQAIWSGGARNFGLKKANGDLVVYLDADDCFGSDHLKIISEEAKDFDWVWFNDLVKTKESEKERQTFINQKFQHGTSNICHKRSLNAMWTSTGYGYDDWGLVQHLLKLSKNYIKIKTPQYVVCHIPKLLDL